MIYNVISYLEQAAQRCPQRIAVADCVEQISYDKLWQYVSQLGNALYSKLDHATNRPVLVATEHTALDVQMFLSVAFSGNCYVPVDLTLPQERLQQIIRTISPAAILLPDGRELPVEPGHIPVWSRGELRQYPNRRRSPWKKSKDTDLLYILFTSGSTGVPKGVAICHRSVVDMVEQANSVFGLPDGTVFGNQATFDFDVSVKDLYLCLKVAGRLEILERKLFSSPQLLVDRLNDRQVDTIIWSVAALRRVCDRRAFQQSKPLYLKNILFSGEVLPVKVLEYWRNALPDARYVNLYGPTEITCNCTYYILDPAISYDAIPIGEPFPNCSVFLLQDGRQVSSADVQGEICVTGSCLAPGYYNNPEQTAAAFVQNPLNPALPERMYRTGDLGCYRSGLLFFCGRADTQIKHLGHRIELSEIELCANRNAGVEASACIYDEEHDEIILFYQGPCDAAALQDFLRSKLPDYMLPARMICVSSFPQTRTGKTDRKKLKEIAAEVRPGE